MTDQYKKALVFTALAAHNFFANCAKGKPHISRRWQMIKEVLPYETSDDDEGWPNFNFNGYDNAKSDALIERALHEGDSEADAALCEITWRFLLQSFEFELPSNLKAFVMVLLRQRFEAPPERRGQRQMDKNFERNFFIVDAIRHLSHEFTPTRNRIAQDSEGPPSGCSIVAEALALIGKPMTERAVEEVWTDRDKFVPPEPSQSSGMTKVR
jgi:hypothetical protein